MWPSLTRYGHTPGVLYGDRFEYILEQSFDLLLIHFVVSEALVFLEDLLAGDEAGHFQNFQVVRHVGLRYREDFSKVSHANVLLLLDDHQFLQNTKPRRV